MEKNDILCLKNKNVLVVGAARSGVCVSKLLKRLGANVTISDSKPLSELSNIACDMRQSEIDVRFGESDAQLVKRSVLVVASPGVPPWVEAFELARKEGVPIIGEMELASVFCKCPVAAVTGTNGKTTVTSMVRDIVASEIENTVAVGNIGVPFSEVVETLTERDFAVIEASSFQLESVTFFKPKISAIVNITPDHLDRHKTFEKYVEAKTNIYKNTDKHCDVILNYDDEILKSLKIETGARILYFSVMQEVEQGAFLDGDVITVKLGGRRERLINVNELQMLGLHNIENALASALIGICAGVPYEKVAESLGNFKGVPHRIEAVRELRGVRYYNDSKGTNPDASIKALNAMKGKTVLIAGGYDKNADFSEFAALFHEKLSRLIVIGETSEKIIDECAKIGFNKYLKVNNFESAVKLAAEAAKPGENVLLSPACASWDMFKDFEERGDYFKALVHGLK